MQFGGRMWRVMLVTAIVVMPRGLPGQPADSSPVAHARCRDAHPRPACGSYFLFEFAAAGRVAGTISERTCPIQTVDCSRPALPSFFGWDIGWMRNPEAARSFGASVQIGGSEEGTRIALRARHRSWLRDDFVADVSAGPLMRQVTGRNQEGTSETYGATADLGIGRARLGVVTVGADVARQFGRTELAAHAGGRVESAGVAIVSALAAIGGIVVLSALGGADY